MKNYFFECFNKPISFFIFFIVSISQSKGFLNAGEYYLKDMQIDSSTKFDEKSSDLPSNPFEIVDMIRRANSMNNATNPSDAIDDALESFNIIDETKKL